MTSESQDNSNSKFEAGRWSSEEHQKFLTGIMKYGKDWKKVEQVVHTRTGSQVRSHAQKFFLKLHKIQKDRKKQKYKHSNQITQTEHEIMKYIHSEDISINTPAQIITLIRQQAGEKSKYTRQVETVNVQHFLQVLEKSQGQLHQTIEVQQSKKNSSDNLQELKKQKLEISTLKNLVIVYQSLNQEEQDPDESFLILLVKQHKDYFLQCQDFSDLIDFGKNKEQSEMTQVNKRKRSFTLPQDQDNEQRLQQALNKIRKVMKTDQNSI